MKKNQEHKTLAYIRVSTDRQDVDNQRLEILALANSKGLGQVVFIEETVSGRKPWRERAVFEGLSSLAAGDALVVSELSRLGRSMLEIMEILSVATTRGVRVFAAKGDWALDGSIQSKLVAMCFSMAAEIERDLIRQRTSAALDTRKRMISDQGHFISKAGNRVTSLGRPRGPGQSKLDKVRDRVIEELGHGVKRIVVAERYGTTPANLRNWLAKRGLGHLGKPGKG